MEFPVDGVIPRLSEALTLGSAAILVAEPGAGKTTRVPLKLLGSSWLGSKKIVMLEPRRLAARAAAKRMAETLGEEIGETVGYTVRLDRKVSARTRIEVVTEGILTRRLQNDPELKDTGLVIFDEFHERSLDGDLGLALTLICVGACVKTAPSHHVSHLMRQNFRTFARCFSYSCNRPHVSG
jgi:ATP-dependent helicase HrpB